MATFVSECHQLDFRRKLVSSKGARHPWQYLKPPLCAHAGLLRGQRDAEL
jgi:hypothetical protein